MSETKYPTMDEIKANLKEYERKQKESIYSVSVKLSFDKLAKKYNPKLRKVFKNLGYYRGYRLGGYGNYLDELSKSK